MNNINNEKIVDFINDIYIENHISEELESLRKYGEQNNIPIIHREVGEFIKTILLLEKPKNILEIGTAIGFSSIFFAKATSDDTRITSIEINDEMISLAKKNIEEFGLANRIEVKAGDARDVIPTLNDKYDFVFIDAAKGQYIKFFELIEPMLTDKAVIISDNILFRGMVADRDLLIRRKRTIVQRLKKYLNMLTIKKGYTTSILPLGDGVALTIKEGK